MKMVKGPGMEDDAVKGLRAYGQSTYTAGCVCGIPIWLTEYSSIKKKGRHEGEAGR